MEKPLKNLFQANEALKSIATSSGFLPFTIGFPSALPGLPGPGLAQNSSRFDIDSGDHLHPSIDGYKALAGSIPLSLFAIVRR